MIDLHCHLLPGLDDGPQTHAETLQLCRIAIVDGITHAIVTPHIHPGRWPNTKSGIALECRKLQRALNKRNLPLKLGFAAEVRLSDDLIAQIDREEIPFYGKVDGYWVMLLEFPHGHIIPGSERLVRWLLRNKVRPLIAHPERNKQVMRRVQEIYPYVEAGCWLQLTGGSILGSFGERAREVAHQLLDDNLVAVVASDGHNSGPRKPQLSDAFDYVCEHYGDARADMLMQQNPARITTSQFQQEAATVC
ncbi:MAG: CpsB/CapC family capsule biosynthesis tyrosine phosphatase [Pseudomonadota bacterium]